MEVVVKGRNIALTDALKQYATEKVDRVSRFFDDDKANSRAEVELVHERNPAIEMPEVVDTTLYINGDVLKAREASQDMYASIDLMYDKLERQVKRYRGRQLDRWHGNKHNAAEGQAGSASLEQLEREDAEPGIVRTKRFEMKPMSPEEAALQLELLDHSFFVFSNAGSGEINVIYRRRDGNYGLIEPAR